VLNNVLIEWAEEGIRFNNSGGELHNSTLRNNVKGINVYENANPVITDNNEITQNSHGIYLYGKHQAGQDPDPVIEGNRIYNNSNFNLYAVNFIDPASTVVSVPNNWWGTENVPDILSAIYEHMDNPGNSPKVNFLPFVANDGSSLTTGTALAGIWDGSSEPLTAGTTYHVLYGLTVPLGQTLDVPQGAELRVYGNGAELRVGGTFNIAGTENSPVTFRSRYTSASNTSWRGIIAQPGSTIAVDHAVIKDAAYGIYFDNTDGDVHHTRFENNDYGVFIKENSNPVITQGNVFTNNDIAISASGNGLAGFNPNPLVNDNSIHDNNLYNYATSAFYNASNTVLDATNNWWGTTDAAQIAQGLLDNAANPGAAAVINYVPYLQSEGGAPSSNGVLSGVWNGTPLSANQTYEVVNDFTIPAGQTLLVPEGVTFDSTGMNTEIIVNGILQVQGTATKPVTFTSSDASARSWYGIVFHADNSVINHARIEYANYGISFMNATGEVHNTLIQNSDRGVYIYGAGSARITDGNTIINNNYGLFIESNALPGNDPTTVFTNNSIYNNSTYNAFLYLFYDTTNLVLDGTDNWWGSANESVIESKLFHNLPGVAPRVNYTSFKTSQP
jgi:parallel beta-helix repeat protein